MTTIAVGKKIWKFRGFSTPLGHYKIFTRLSKVSNWSTVKCPLCLLSRLLRASITFFPSGVPRLSKVKEKSPTGLVSGLCSRRHCLYVIAQFHYSWAKSKVLRRKKVTRAGALQGRYLRVDSIKYFIITYEKLIS